MLNKRMLSVYLTSNKELLLRTGKDKSHAKKWSAPKKQAQDTTGMVKKKPKQKAIQEPEEDGFICPINPNSPFRRG
jgi:hypothetical protein